ncbi:ABC transporter ATP-binding protein [Streptomonospora wellingtoniae]|uniref:ABC transporter ATP-binding protein n=1 Tax=Streptomonospora wellingtoniae TaxID=3075544 RepID=A0ABU2KT78_9ACTN|nr:ABC transporter ATP-binding protein [Streptomonospora sp. DSM 45055]MDT0302460.1 ABC transporter ATP-binding protein [Streptomonospora sp. DSM 45055]
MAVTQTAESESGGRAGLGESVRRMGHALALAWRAGPFTASLYLVTTVVLGLLPAGVALLTKWLIDALQFAGSSAPAPAPAPSGPEISPMMLVVLIGLMGLVQAVGTYLSTYLTSRIKRGVTLVVQHRLYSAVNRLEGVRRFEDPAFRDRLRLAQQAAITAPDAVIQALFGALQRLLTITGFLGVLVAISPVITVITIAAALPALFVQLSISRQQASMMWRMSPRTRRRMFYQTLMLDLAAIKETRLFGSGGFLLGRMHDETVSVNSAEERLDRRILLTQGPLSVLSAVVASGGLVWMIAATIRGEFTIGDVSAFIAAVAGVQGAMTVIVADITRGYQSLLLLGHYVDVVRVGPDLPVPADPRPVAPLRGEIRLDDVWFRYTDDGPWVIRGLSMTIPAGSTLAIVGLNGAGKSTLVKLLCRMYDPTFGSIRWDGADIREFRVDDLRSRISAVFQDYMSYDLSARENIGISSLEHMDDADRIDAAARDAGAADFSATLPRGYDTMLSRMFYQDEGDGSDGVTLSGGQWQRLAIARALMRRGRDLLFLDEPMSGLDAAAEQDLHERLRVLRAGATTVLTSHRLGTLRYADRIVVMQEGRITEEGGHDALMSVQGEYARLFSLQAADYVDGDTSEQDASKALSR